MGRARQWMILGLIFLAGTVTGVFGLGAWAHAHLRDLHGAGGGAIDQLVLAGLDVHLDLDETQEAAARRIVRDVHLQLREYHLEHVDALGLILEQGLADLEAVLREDQLDDWAAVRGQVHDHLHEARAARDRLHAEGAGGH